MLPAPHLPAHLRRPEQLRWPGHRHWSVPQQQQRPVRLMMRVVLQHTLEPPWWQGQGQGPWGSHQHHSYLQGGKGGRILNKGQFLLVERRRAFLDELSLPFCLSGLN